MHKFYWSQIKQKNQQNVHKHYINYVNIIIIKKTQNVLSTHLLCMSWYLKIH